MPTQTEAIDQSREMDERTWWDLWNTAYRADDNRDKTSIELFSHVIALMRKVLQEGDNRMLEVACGTGTLSRSLNCTSYHGLDISSAAVEIACQKAATLELAPGTPRPTYEIADFHDWPLPAQPFDVVLCVDAISGFRDQAFVLRKITQCLRNGGLAVLTTPNPFVYNRIRRVGGVKLESGPVSHWLSRREMYQLVKRAGLTLERSYTIMPRGNMGILRAINSPRLNRVFGSRVERTLHRLKERVGLGQYRVVVARKS
jgi:2-polyprenyl-3-methyl-5-hydroxy-6-metoxy-1,4-benzoquinol methylase